MGRTSGIVAVSLCICLCLLACVGGKLRGPSDEEQVSAAVSELKAAWEAKDAERILACYSRDYTYSDGSDFERLEQWARAVAETPDVQIEVFVDEMEISIERGEARVRGVKSRVSGPEGEGEFGLEYRLRKENGKWVITWSNAWSIR